MSAPNTAVPGAQPAGETGRINEAMKREYYAWREVCRHLDSCGAVTQMDLAAPMGNAETPGQILLVALAEWGKAKQDLGGAREARPKNGVSQLSLV